jgi:hypothetical protein
MPPRNSSEEFEKFGISEFIDREIEMFGENEEDLKTAKIMELIRHRVLT